MTRREKQWRRILSTSLLDAGSNSDCENRTGTDMKLKELGLVWHSLKEIGTVVLGLATSHCRNWQKLMLKRQVRWVDQTQYPMIVVASLSAVPQSCRTPLLWQVDNRYQNEDLKKHETSKIEVLHLSDVPRTHTHFHTQRLSHPAFTHTHTRFYTHTHAFTHSHFYTGAFTHRHFCTQTLLHKHFHTQRLLHTDAFTHRHFYTQTLLHRETFTHRRFYTQTLLHTETGSVKSQFYLSFWRSNLISCERVPIGQEKSQFYFSFWLRNLISCERVATGTRKP